MQFMPAAPRPSDPDAGGHAPPAVLSIAGLDPSSGAGFTADLKVFAAHHLFGLACPTALTVQSTQGVRRTEPVRAALITDTLECLGEDIAIAGVKIGMLGSSAAVRAVAAWLARAAPVPVVLDPVLRASSGAPLLDETGTHRLIAELLPLVSVVTPNLPEAAALSGDRVEGRSGVPAAARALLARCRPDAAVVVTGGHFAGDDTPDDFLLTAANEGGEWFAGSRVHTRQTHGTGCAFSAALLCGLVAGHTVQASVRAAKEYVWCALRAAYPVGQGRGPLHHLFPRDRA